MIGQRINKEIVQEFVRRNSFPRFIIVIGEKGSGRKTFIKYIAKQLGVTPVIFGNKIEEVRDVIDMAYNQSEPYLYVITEYESMSLASKNALLKVAEEPPQKAYIALTASNKNDILPTILGRGTVIELSDYSLSELQQIAMEMKANPELVNIAYVPGDFETAKDLDVPEFIKFVNSVWDNIRYASQGNALKLSNKLKIKDSDEGYDIVLFLNALTEKALDWISQHKNNKNLIIIDNILKLVYNTKMQLGGRYSKIGVVDNFILKFKELMDGII